MSQLGWWNQGVSEYAFKTYRFLVAYRIPNRCRMLQVRSWRVNIIDMLQEIPSIENDLRAPRYYFEKQKIMDTYYSSINSKLTVYEKLTDIATVLELALWKSNIFEQNLRIGSDHHSAKRLELRITSGADIIIPNVLSFLIVDCWPN